MDGAAKGVRAFSKAVPGKQERISGNESGENQMIFPAFGRLKTVPRRTACTMRHPAHTPPIHR